MPTITITRRPAVADRLRAYAVMVDDARIGTVRQGETFRCDVGTGRHEVRLTVDWCGSPTVVIDVEDRDVDLVCAPHRNLPWLAAFMLFTPNQWIDLRVDPPAARP